MQAPLAPELVVSRWFNTSSPLNLAGLLGRPVLIHAFQMLCPGCVMHGTPQAQKAHVMFRDTDLQVIGLHTVFEHHEAMSSVALEAYIQEFRLTMPIAIDQPGDGMPTPVTMRRLGLRGTPSSVLIGRDGRIRHHGFGQEDDMAVGAMIAAAIAEKPVTTAMAAAGMADTDACTDDFCPAP